MQFHDWPSNMKTKEAINLSILISNARNVEGNLEGTRTFALTFREFVRIQSCQIGQYYGQKQGSCETVSAGLSCCTTAPQVSHEINVTTLLKERSHGK